MPENIREVLTKMAKHGADPWAQSHLVADLARAVLAEEAGHAVEGSGEANEANAPASSD